MGYDIIKEDYSTNTNCNDQFPKETLHKVPKVGVAVCKEGVVDEANMEAKEATYETEETEKLYISVG
jgi:hypothetical protein